jgi:hypothetical protein
MMLVNARQLIARFLSADAQSDNNEFQDQKEDLRIRMHGKPICEG